MEVETEKEHMAKQCQMGTDCSVEVKMVKRCQDRDILKSPALYFILIAIQAYTSFSDTPAIIDLS